MTTQTKARKLNYLDDAIWFMKSLLRQGKKDSARAIKSVLLEICRQGTEYPDMTPSGETENMYRLYIPPVKTDNAYHQGFQVTLIVMENHVLATSIGPEVA